MAIKTNLAIGLVSLSILFVSACSDSGSSSTSAPVNTTPPSENTIVNPVAPNGHDPFVTKKDGIYYYIYSTDGAIWVNTDSNIQDAVQFNGQPIWRPEPGHDYSEEIWAPEIFFIDGNWYVYFAADDGDNVNHRMYVLKSKTEDALGEYEFVGKISAPSDKWAIDGTVLSYRDELYFIWSGWEGDENVQQNLYIAKMDGPTTISSYRSLISEPTHSWETIGEPLVNEGPQVLVNPDGQVYVIYSASGSWTDHYALGQLKLDGNDPLNPSAWIKLETPVFAGTDKVYSPGHASFTTSPDDSEYWIVYHAAKQKGAGWNRDVNMKSFIWQPNGDPDFGSPVEKGVAIPAPSE